MKIPMPEGTEDNVALLRRRIEESGLSIRQFALTVVLREDRTVRRWLKGSFPIPEVVLAWLKDPYAPSWPRRRRRRKK